MDEKRIIEINGVKLEIDLRTAKQVDSYKVGDPVKVLIKNYSGYTSYVGTIIGFDAFLNLPTIIVAYLEKSYGSAGVKFVYFNNDTKDVEICPMFESPFLEREEILSLFDSDIVKKEQELIDLKTKRQYFLEHFNQYFKEQSK